MTFAGGVNSADHALTFPTLVNLLKQQVVICGISRSKHTLCNLPVRLIWGRKVHLGNQP